MAAQRRVAALAAQLSANETRQIAPEPAWIGQTKYARIATPRGAPPPPLACTRSAAYPLEPLPYAHRPDQDTVAARAGAPEHKLPGPPAHVLPGRRSRLDGSTSRDPRAHTPSRPRAHAAPDPSAPRAQADTQTKERMMLEIERDPAFANDDRHDLTRPETRERTMRKVRARAGAGGARAAKPLPPPRRARQR